MVLIAWVAVNILNAVPLFPNLTLVVWIFSAVFGVLGAMSAGRGTPYRYPLTYRFLT